MIRQLSIAAALTALTLSLPASARNSTHHFPIADAVAAAENAPAESQVDPAVKLYWGNQGHPKPAQKFGTYTSNKKTNFFNKSDKEGCEWAWLSAVKSLQDRAKAEGGNAVVNIISYYKKNEFSSETEYECVAGAVLGGVALRGTVVKLP